MSVEENKAILRRYEVYVLELLSRAIMHGEQEIVRYYPQEWSDVHEIARLRSIILAELMYGFDL